MNANIQKVKAVNTKSDYQANSVLRLFTARRKVETEKAVYDDELLKTIVEAKNEWLDASMNFENVYEEQLVDYYTYKMKACEARYAYFIKMAKEQG